MPQVRVRSAEFASLDRIPCRLPCRLLGMVPSKLFTPGWSLVLMAGTAGAFGVQPATAGGLPCPSLPLMAKLFEWGAGVKVAPGPSKANAAAGGWMVEPATSYWPMRRLPAGVIAREVIT